MPNADPVEVYRELDIEGEYSVYLIGHVRERKAVSSFVSCAQLCLRNRPLCRSLNYGEEEGKTLCELNDEAVQDAETGFTTLASKPEFSFAQLLDLETVSTTDLILIWRSQSMKIADSR